MPVFTMCLLLFFLTFGVFKTCQGFLIHFFFSSAHGLSVSFTNEVIVSHGGVMVSPRWPGSVLTHNVDSRVKPEEQRSKQRAARGPFGVQLVYLCTLLASVSP